jgi:hypothetical protein
VSSDWVRLVSLLLSMFSELHGRTTTRDPQVELLLGNVMPENVSRLSLGRHLHRSGLDVLARASLVQRSSSGKGSLVRLSCPDKTLQTNNRDHTTKTPSLDTHAYESALRVRRVAGKILPGSSMGARTRNSHCYTGEVLFYPVLRFWAFRRARNQMQCLYVWHARTGSTSRNRAVGHRMGPSAEVRVHAGCR